MDYLIVKAPGQGVATTMGSELSKIGPVASIRLGDQSTASIDLQIQEVLSAAPGKPISVLIDLDGSSADSFSPALIDVLQNRTLAGALLPKGSTVVITVDQADFASVSPAVVARSMTVDMCKPHLTSQGVERGELSQEQVAANIGNALRDLSMHILLERNPRIPRTQAPGNPALG